MRHTCAPVLAVVAFAGLLCSPATTAPLSADHGPGRGNEQARPLAEYKGLTSGDWLAVWWQEVFATGVEGGRHPLITGGAFGGKNGIVFLAAPVVPAGDPRVTIRATVPAGTHLFVPIITVECSEEEPEPFGAKGEDNLRACANGLLDEVSDLSVKIDGKPLKNPGSSRVDTPLFRYGPLVGPSCESCMDGNVLGLQPRIQSDAVGAGHALLLPPFSPGVHRIIIRANVAAFGIAVDTEFIIKVKPQPAG